MAHSWDDDASQWEANPATQQFVKSVFNQLLTIRDIRGDRVLDFGCGTGLLTQNMSPLAKEIVALDASEAMIEELDKKQLTNVEPVVDHLTRGLVAQHPAFRGQFDVVVAASVCEYLDDLDSAFDIVHSLLNKGGLFIHWDWLQDGQSGLEIERAQQAYAKAGFRDIRVAKAFDIHQEDALRTVIVGIGYR